MAYFLTSYSDAKRAPVSQRGTMEFCVLTNFKSMSNFCKFHVSEKP